MAPARMYGHFQFVHANWTWIAQRFARRAQKPSEMRVAIGLHCQGT